MYGKVMIGRIKALFVERGGKPAAGEKRHSLDELHLAAAVLLVEAARMDGHVDAAEEVKIKTLLETRFGLESSEVETLVSAAHGVAEHAAELWSFVRPIKNRFSHAERVELIEMLWEVAYADGVLHDYEAHLLRRIGGLIYVSDQERGAARKRVLARLGQAGAGT